MMRRIIACLLLAPMLAFATPFDIVVTQRNATDTGLGPNRLVPPPANNADGIMGYVGATQRPIHWGIGPGLSLSGGVLSAMASAPTWEAITGKPAFSPVATSGSYTELANRPTLFSGAYADLTGKPVIPAAQVPADWSATTGPAQILNKPALFSGVYGDLSGLPASFAPSPHTHAAGDITSGTLSSARLPQLSIAQTTGLQAALDAKLAAPSGTTSQYLRGDGSLATFPTIPAGQVQVDWNATSGLSSIANKPALAPVATAGTYASLTGTPSTFAPSAHSQAWSTITATPTTLAGYGVTDGVTQAALTSSLGSYATTNALTAGLATKFNQPTGTTAQYVRGDGSLATLPVGRRIETYSGTTNAQGQITVTYPTAFPVAPVVQPPAPALANQVWTTVANTTTGFTMQLNQRNTVNLLSTEVLLGATVPVNGTAAIFLVVAQ